MSPLDNFDFSINSNKEKLELGEEQVNALQKLEEFVSNKEDCITLSGFAGTGKTSILKEFIGYLDDEELPYILAAPTHRAKLVLEALTDAKKTYTLHQLLSLSPDIEIFELDYRDLLFKVEEAFNNKTLVRLPERNIFRIKYNKNTANYNNKSFMEFQVNRNIKMRLKQKIKNNEIDAFNL